MRSVESAVLLCIGSVEGIDGLGGAPVSIQVLANGFGPLLIGSGGEVEFVITPYAALGPAAQQVVEVYIAQPLLVCFVHKGLHQAVGFEPARSFAVRGVVVEDAVEVNLRFGAAPVYALHHALHVGQHLLGLEVQAVGSDVVGANHHEEFLRFVDEVTLQVGALLGRIGA